MAIITNIFSKMMKYNKEGMPVDISKFGKLTLAGLTVAATANNAMNEETNLRIGPTDGKIYTNTPGYQNYLQMKPQRNINPLEAPGGADGSLVFALHNTRNGGYL